MAVVASPYGQSSQWISTQPDSTGRYRMTLMPGGYRVQAGSSTMSPQRTYEIIVEPGKTVHRDFQLEP
jgi:hypothetical protein